jgi:methylated-DNA-[protein]-cysteine S-methyltransferase
MNKNPVLRLDHPGPLGPLTLVAQGGALIGIYFPAHKPGGPPAGKTVSADPALDETRRQLDAYFAGKRQSFALPLRPTGTPFQARVWLELQRIKYGATETYGAIALALGQPTATRAAASAIARNPISIIIPCHRVVGANGALTGFAGGVDRKRRLLGLEQVGPAALSP